MIAARALNGLPLSSNRRPAKRQCDERRDGDVERPPQHLLGGVEAVDDGAEQHDLAIAEPDQLRALVADCAAQPTST